MSSEIFCFYFRGEYGMNWRYHDPWMLHDVSEGFFIYTEDSHFYTRFSCHHHSSGLMESLRYQQPEWPSSPAFSRWQLWSQLEGHFLIPLCWLTSTFDEFHHRLTTRTMTDQYYTFCIREPTLIRTSRCGGWYGLLYEIIPQVGDDIPLKVFGGFGTLLKDLRRVNGQKAHWTYWKGRCNGFGI